MITPVRTFLSHEPHPAGDVYRPEPLGDRVYETLLTHLISLKIPPAGRIAVDALVREFGVSQTPIRAALIRLETEGLVVRTHNIGYSAAPLPSRHRFEEIYDMRSLLEPYLAARAAKTIGLAGKQALRALGQAMVTPSGENAKLAYGKFAMQDADFHAFIAANGGNDLAKDALARLHAHTHVFRLRYHAHVTEEAIEEHAAIIEAITAGDPIRAQDAMQHHIQRSRARMAPFFEAIE